MSGATQTHPVPTHPVPTQPVATQTHPVPTHPVITQTHQVTTYEEVTTQTDVQVATQQIVEANLQTGVSESQSSEDQDDWMCSLVRYRKTYQDAYIPSEPLVKFFNEAIDRSSFLQGTRAVMNSRISGDDQTVANVLANVASSLKNNNNGAIITH